MIQLVHDKKSGLFCSDDPQTITALRKSFYGFMRNGKIHVTAIEALYLAELRNAKIMDSGFSAMGMEKILSLEIGKRFVTRYFVYRDWRDRGMHICHQFFGEKTDHMLEIEYPSGKCNAGGLRPRGIFFPDELTCIVSDSEAGKTIYSEWWFGQYGTYKLQGRGKLLKLDCFETLFLMDRDMVSVSNASRKQVLKSVSKRLANSDMLYAVYSDWRSLGYVVKTGFKFGTHFRVYFPGAKPESAGMEHLHSKHVIHVFPRESSFVISEWSRAIRVAHSVKKTFILAIPGKAKKGGKTKAKCSGSLGIDFYAQGRVADSLSSAPRPKTYAMFCMHEDDVVSGESLAEIIESSKLQGIDLLIGIVDRETSVTYYMVKRIRLHGSRYDYYELEWIQP